MNFNDRASLGLPPDVTFSNDPRQLRAALLGRRPEGKTALYDALALAADHLAKGKWENKALLLISDGGDNTSTHSFSEAIHGVQKSGATIYTIALYDPDEPEHNLAALHRLSKMSGGEALVPMELSEIGALCVRIAEDIRASYTIAYTPPHPDQHGQLRKVKIVAAPGAGGKLRVRARTGYTLADR